VIHRRPDLLHILSGNCDVPLMDRGMTSAVVGCHFDINESVIYFIRSNGNIVRGVLKKLLH